MCSLVSGARVRHHRVGQVETDPIDSSFPNAAKALVPEASQRQLSLFSQPEFIGNEGYESVALAYMANPTDGLCAVYLCEVGEIDDTDHIISWINTRLVYKRGLNPDPETQGDELAPEEKTPNPKIRRLRKVKPRNG